MTKDEALKKTLVLSCRGCGARSEAHPDCAIEDPGVDPDVDDGWIGLVDETGPCQRCQSNAWVYER